MNCWADQTIHGETREKVFCSRTRGIPGPHAAPTPEKKVRASLQTILNDPAVGKELKEELAGLRSFRVSRYRIIYRSSAARQIETVAVGPRERIYEETYRLLQKDKGDQSI